MRSPLIVPVLLALPGVALAGVGLLHPHGLDYATSERWWKLHVPGLLVFPLVGVALTVLVRGRADPLAWVVRLTAYVYMTCYSALDVIDGLGAGYLTYRAGGDRAQGADRLFDLGHPYESWGSWGLIACAVAVLVDQVARRRAPGLVAVVLVAGAWMVHSDHIFSPTGAAGMLLIGLTTGLLAALETGWVWRKAHETSVPAPG